MSLGQWFRDYVYIPLGGNRVSKIKHIRNIFAVWLLTGFWHGAAWNFIIWGLFFAVLLMIEKLYLGKYLKKHPCLSRIYVLFCVVISFVIFNASSMTEAMQYIGGLFSIGSSGFIGAEAVYYLRSYFITVIIAIIGSTPLVKNTVLKIKQTDTGKKLISIFSPVFVAFVIILCTAYLVDGSFNPFLYFRF